MKTINKLKDLYPDLINEIDMNKNKKLDIDSISVSSNKSIYWICENGHSYKMPVSKRTGNRKSKCPYCLNRRLLVGFNDLKYKYPDVALEWDYSKNEKNPEDYVYGSTFKAYWKCKECGYVWLTEIRKRTKKASKCPVCAKKEQRIKKHIGSLKKSGGITNELLIKEWDYELNESDPSQYTKGSPAKVSWICSKCGYKYKAAINNRTIGRGCPLCSNKVVVKGKNDLLTTYPNIAKEWDYSRNDITPEDVTYGHGKKVWWICPNGHSYQATVNHRTGKNGTNCPICFKGRQTSFAEQAFYYYIKKVFSDAINSYKDIFKNGMELDIYIPSLRLGIEYDGEAWHKKNRFERDSKKYKICQENNIRLLRLKEKNYEGDIYTADKIFCMDKMYQKENLYQAIFWVISDIDPKTNMWTRKNFNSYYTKLDIDLDRDENEIRNYMTELSKDSLYDLYPNIANEWDYNKNITINPKKVKSKSNIKVWWICSECGNSYKSSIISRTSGTGCPKCGIIKNTLKRSKSVNMIDLNTNEVIRTFISISEASRKMNISSGNITAVLKGKRRHTKGYRWEYVKQYDQ